jgi:membrane protein implicated in regulation of membrane protease activity
LLWSAIGAALVALELIVPGLFLLWFGAAALVTGLMAWIGGGWGLLNELALFTALAACAVGAAMAFARRPRPKARPNGINDRAGQLIGRQVALSEPIAGGRGRIFIGDTLWPVEGPDLAAGTMVRITGHKGMVLMVQAVEPSPARPADAASRQSPSP